MVAVGGGCTEEGVGSSGFSGIHIVCCCCCFCCSGGGGMVVVVTVPVVAVVLVAVVLVAVGVVVVLVVVVLVAGVTLEEGIGLVLENLVVVAIGLTMGCGGAGWWWR